MQGHECQGGIRKVGGTRVGEDVGNEVASLAGSLSTDLGIDTLFFTPAILYTFVICVCCVFILIHLVTTENR